MEQGQAHELWVCRKIRKRELAVSLITVRTEGPRIAEKLNCGVCSPGNWSGVARGLTDGRGLAKCPPPFRSHLRLFTCPLKPHC